VPLIGFFRQPRVPRATHAADRAAEAVTDSYVAWRKASCGVQAAYERWAAWESSDRDLAFAAYLAALENEEHAARVYEKQIKRLRRASRSTPGVSSPRQAT
jgi:hypothetical protein